MSTKLTWDAIFEDFRTRYPKRRDEVIHWCPVDYATILIFLEDGTKWSYNYLEHRVRILYEK